MHFRSLGEGLGPVMYNYEATLQKNRGVTVVDPIYSNLVFYTSTVRVNFSSHVTRDSLAPEGDPFRSREKNGAAWRASGLLFFIKPWPTNMGWNDLVTYITEESQLVDELLMWIIAEKWPEATSKHVSATVDSRYSAILLLCNRELNRERIPNAFFDGTRTTLCELHFRVCLASC